MKLARVMGSVVSTVKHSSYQGGKLMIVQPLDEKGAPKGASYLALDRAQCGPGDLVLVMSEGNGVRQLIPGDPPIRSLVVGIVDQVDLSWP